jgi:hypothetical protein
MQLRSVRICADIQYLYQLAMLTTSLRLFSHLGAIPCSCPDNKPVRVSNPTVKFRTYLQRSHIHNGVVRGAFPAPLKVIISGILSSFYGIENFRSVDLGLIQSSDRIITEEVIRYLSLQNYRQHYDLYF